MGEHRSGGFSVNSSSSDSSKQQTFQTTGALIMQIADLLRPRLLEQLRGSIDENGMQLQPARVRGMALIIAQEMVKNAKNQAN